MTGGLDRDDVVRELAEVAEQLAITSVKIGELRANLAESPLDALVLRQSVVLLKAMEGNLRLLERRRTVLEQMLRSLEGWEQRNDSASRNDQ